ncbi:MAG: PaaI family thioesterase [Albimonas sp.]|uniref:PaaI family thioesterase n=1 Tax=Albimonas sp. TaxID=1872425 RepID=UPI004055FE1D
MSAGARPPRPTPAMRGFGDFVGTRTVAIKPNWGMVEIDLDAWHLNGLPTVHGGVVLTLLDHACGAALTWGSGEEVGKAGVTLALSTSFLRGAQGGRLFGIGRCVKRGRSIAFCEAHVEDETGEPIARANGSFKLVAR